jgi:molybdenum cofactor synthesis domain-containing protein
VNDLARKRCAHRDKTLNLAEARVALLTVSDSCASGVRSDASGKVLVQLLEAQGAQVLKTAIVCDDKKLIKAKIKYFCDTLKVDLVLTTGGTGFGPRDVTPEATKEILEKETPGLCELMRQAGFKKTKRAVLSRAVAGIRGRALVVNLPGSPKGVCESFEAIAELIPHALLMMKGEGH